MVWLQTCNQVSTQSIESGATVTQDSTLSPVIHLIVTDLDTDRTCSSLSIRPTMDILTLFRIGIVCNVRRTALCHLLEQSVSNMSAAQQYTRVFLLSLTCLGHNFSAIVCDCFSEDGTLAQQAEQAWFLYTLSTLIGNQIVFYSLFKIRN